MSRQDGFGHGLRGIAAVVVDVEHVQGLLESAGELGARLRQEVADALEFAEDPVDGRRRDGSVVGEVVDRPERLVGEFGPAGHVLALVGEADQGAAAVEAGSRRW